MAATSKTEQTVVCGGVAGHTVFFRGPREEPHLYEGLLSVSLREENVKR